MLGMVFTEFLEMVEQRWSASLVDQLLTEVKPACGGSYTAIGYYPSAELAALVDALASHTQNTPAATLQAFGHYLFGRFLLLHPRLFADQHDCFALLAGIDQQIHREVRKLYPQAELPTFTVREHSAKRLVLEYHSARPLADLAEGLIRACLQHYHDSATLSRTDTLNQPDPSSEQGSSGALFELTRP
jgi:hypothetical protein